MTVVRDQIDISRSFALRGVPNVSSARAQTDRENEGGARGSEPQGVSVTISLHRFIASSPGGR